MKKGLKISLIILGVLIILGGVITSLVKSGIISKQSNSNLINEDAVIYFDESYAGDCCSCCSPGEICMGVCCPCK